MSYIFEVFEVVWVYFAESVQRPVRGQWKCQGLSLAGPEAEVLQGRVQVVYYNFLEPNRKLCWPRGLLQDTRWKWLTAADICFTCTELLCPCSLRKHMIALRGRCCNSPFWAGDAEAQRSLCDHPQATRLFPWAHTQELLHQSLSL